MKTFYHSLSLLPCSSRSVLGCEKDYKKFELGKKHLDIAGLDEQITSNKETVPVLSRIELEKEKVNIKLLSLLKSSVIQTGV